MALMMPCCAIASTILQQHGDRDAYPFVLITMLACIRLAIVIVDTKRQTTCVKHSERVPMSRCEAFAPG